MQLSITVIIPTRTRSNSYVIYQIRRFACDCESADRPEVKCLPSVGFICLPHERVDISVRKHRGTSDIDSYNDRFMVKYYVLTLSLYLYVIMRAVWQHIANQTRKSITLQPYNHIHHSLLRSAAS